MMGDGDKIEWLTAENQRLRQELEAQSVHNGSMIREYRPRNAFDATDLEARSLVAKVQEAYPAVRWQIPPNSAFEELQRNYMRQFRAAMIGLSTMVRRAEAVDYGHALSFWIETVEEANKLRDRARGAGVATFVDRTGGDQALWRVRAGPFVERTSAESARTTLKTKLQSDGVIVTQP